MKTSAYPDAVLATPRSTDINPALPTEWRIRRVTLGGLLNIPVLPAITIIRADSPKELPDYARFARRLDHKLNEKKGPNYLVLTFKQREELPLEERVKLLKPFAQPERIEIREGAQDLRRLIEHLSAKIEVLSELQAQARLSPPRTSPLDQVKAVVSVSGDLRVNNGNLSGKPIAHVFGVSLNRLAQWLGRTRQALTKTPDADSLQDALSYFERIARLRAVLEGSAEFRKWLRLPNPQLDGDTPLQWIQQKRWQPLADLVDDMLTGAPT